MKNINIIFPHQLFKDHPIHHCSGDFYIIEEFLFFKQYNFHKSKIALHRASMKFYANFLKEKGLKVHYIESIHKMSDIREFIQQIDTTKINAITYIDPTDEWLQARIKKESQQKNIKTTCLNTALFLNNKKELASFFKPTKKKFYHATFYKQQRVKHQILVNQNNTPVGEQWSFDADNRKKYPAKNTPPSVLYPQQDAYWTEAIEYVSTHFANNVGSITNTSIFPHTFKTAEQWLLNFLETRFYAFGDYEDAILKQNNTLHHSIISPMLNTGLLTTKEVIHKILLYAEQQNITLNNTEGIIRQLIGWREFIRGMYITKGNYARTHNFWNFTRKIPPSFYTGTTGVAPVDNTIKSILKNGYCHHIERLMVLGNFMMLCEFDPNEVYQWFMELFIDAYDWVMVPNVYGMSQFADGGLFATKPYISSSNYILKMSNYPKGDWQIIWDSLFWNFMSKHRLFFETSPRLKMLLKNLDKMENSKKQNHINNANNYLKKLCTETHT